jgi:hypothetical protein
MEKRNREYGKGKSPAFQIHWSLLALQRIFNFEWQIIRAVLCFLSHVLLELLLNFYMGSWYCNKVMPLILVTMVWWVELSFDHQHVLVRILYSPLCKQPLLVWINDDSHVTFKTLNSSN